MTITRVVVPQVACNRTLAIGVDVCDGDHNREWTATVVRASDQNCSDNPNKSAHQMQIKVVASGDESSGLEDSDAEADPKLSPQKSSKLRVTPTRHCPVKVDNPSGCKAQ